MQVESSHIGNPFREYLRYKGWHVEKTHGSQYQEGFPDLYCMHPKYDPKWVETKVLRGGDFSFTVAQLAKFPVWIAHGVKIWIIYGTDFRGPAGKLALERAYQTLFNPPNAAYMLNPMMRRELLR